VSVLFFLSQMTSNPAPAVYGGDEVNALVLDTGSYWTRVGFAGEDSPRAVIPTHYGSMLAGVDAEELPDADGPAVGGPKKTYYFGDSDLNYPRPGMDISNPMKDGVVQDWDAITSIWSHGLENILQTDAKDSPMLFTEQIWNSDASREKMMEVAFEHFEAAATYIVKSPVCSLFASGKGSGLVVDIGAAVTTVTPVLDGLVLFKNSRRTEYAGNFVNQKTAELFKKLNIDVTPYYMIASKEVVPTGSPAKFVPKSFVAPLTTSFHDYQISRVYDEFKESQVQVADSPLPIDGNETNNTSGEGLSVRKWELPTGASYDLKVDRYQVGEYLFNPDPSKRRDPPTQKSNLSDGTASDAKIANTEGDGENKEKATQKDKDSKEKEEEVTASLLYTDRTTSSFSDLGLSDLIVDSITKCDVDIQANLANHIVITGGSSLIQGLTDRTFNDLTQALSGLKIRIHAPGNTMERKYSAWIGGSILASLGTFHQLWISKQEYQEVGPAKLLEKRFR
jgi:actin-related protein 4